MASRTLNLGILAHVDAGKTTLTERLLYAAGVIDAIGRVDDGTTQTDTLALERQRGITIRSAVVSFAIGETTVNLIDTPGHPDFIAEVERVLSVLDGAVLVVSAVEGVQAQTRVLWRALQRLGIPTLFFLNKTDRVGADCARVLEQIRERLTPAAILLGEGSGEAELAELLAEHDDELLAALVDGRAPGPLRDRLAAQTRRGLVQPAFAGSAITGAGLEELTAGIAELLPAAEGDADGPVSAGVFKVERGAAGEKIAYARVDSGTIRVRDRLPVRRDDRSEAGEAKVTAIGLFDGGACVRGRAAPAGRICRLWGLADARIGDRLGEPGTRPPARHAFAPPTLESVVVPRRPGEKAALHAALVQLAEQDPLIDLRRDDEREELSVSLYGEVQKEVIEATLADEFGLEVEFRETTTICVERPAGSGEAVELLGSRGTPFDAGIGLRVEPSPEPGISFGIEVELGSLPLSFFVAVEEAARETLRQGLCGWQVTGCAVTAIYSSFSPLSGAGDFRNLTPLVVAEALRLAGTTVCEPMLRVAAEIPADTVGAVLSVLARLEAAVQAQVPRGSSCVVEAVLPAARVHDLERQLPALTRGEGVVESEFDHYREVRGEAPARARTDWNPLDRKEYLLRFARRRAGG